jgi:hypothetical protein
MTEVHIGNFRILSDFVREMLMWVELAEGVGFEPTNELPRCRFSRPVP